MQTLIHTIPATSAFAIWAGPGVENGTETDPIEVSPCTIAFAGSASGTWTFDPMEVPPYTTAFVVSASGIWTLHVSDAAYRGIFDELACGNER